MYWMLCTIVFYSCHWHLTVSILLYNFSAKARNQVGLKVYTEPMWHSSFLRRAILVKTEARLSIEKGRNETCLNFSSGSFFWSAKFSFPDIFLIFQKKKYFRNFETKNPIAFEFVSARSRKPKYNHKHWFFKWNNQPNNHQAMFFKDCPGRVGKGQTRLWLVL